MFDLDCLQLSSLHQEPSASRLPTPAFSTAAASPGSAWRRAPCLPWAICSIRTGQRLKEAPRRLEAEPASLASLTIIL